MWYRMCSSQAALRSHRNDSHFDKREGFKNRLGGRFLWLYALRARPLSAPFLPSLLVAALTRGRERPIFVVFEKHRTRVLCGLAGRAPRIRMSHPHGVDKIELLYETSCAMESARCVAGGGPKLNHFEWANWTQQMPCPLDSALFNDFAGLGYS